MKILILGLILSLLSACASEPVVQDKEGIRRVFRQEIRTMKSCYDSELAKDPKIEGKVVLEFQILGSGKVGTAGIKSTTLNNKVVEDCMVSKLKTFQFPKPPEKTAVTVTFPFVFAPTKDADMTFPAKHISSSINAKPDEIYKFASNPENLPKWASGLSKSKMEKVGKDWFADSPMGRVKVKFAAPNTLGVMDHDVTLPSGQVVHNPLRVLKNGLGSEVVFTLYRQVGTSDQDFEADTNLVTEDLARLKSIFTEQGQIVDGTAMVTINFCPAFFIEIEDSERADILRNL